MCVDDTGNGEVTAWTCTQNRWFKDFFEMVCSICKSVKDKLFQTTGPEQENECFP